MILLPNAVWRVCSLNATLADLCKWHFLSDYHQITWGVRLLFCFDVRWIKQDAACARSGCGQPKLGQRSAVTSATAGASLGLRSSHGEKKPKQKQQDENGGFYEDIISIFGQFGPKTHMKGWTGISLFWSLNSLAHLFSPLTWNFLTFSCSRGKKKLSPTTRVFPGAAAFAVWCFLALTLSQEHWGDVSSCSFYQWLSETHKHGPSPHIHPPTMSRHTHSPLQTLLWNPKAGIDW